MRQVECCFKLKFQLSDSYLLTFSTIIHFLKTRYSSVWSQCELGISLPLQTCAKVIISSKFEPLQIRNFIQSEGYYVEGTEG